MAASRYSNALAYRPYGPTPGVYGNAAPSNALAAMMGSYNPSAIAAVTPFAAPTVQPAQQAMPMQQAAAPAAPAVMAPPQQPNPTPPVSVGSQTMGTNWDGGQAGSDSTGMGNDLTGGLGPNPGDLNGLGLAGNLGGMFGAIGGLAGPLGGLLGSGIGTAMDIGTVNDALSRNGITEQVGLMDSLGMLGNGMLGIGTSPADVFSDIAGRNMTENPDLEGQMAQAAMAGLGPVAQVAPMAPAAPMAGEGYSDFNAAAFGLDTIGGLPSLGDLAAAGAFGPDFGGFGGGGEGGYGGNDAAGSADSSAGGFGPDGEGSGGMGAGNDGNGWYTGGYTGAGRDGRVDPMQPAGTVHEGEIVVPADMVAHYGRDALMGLVDGSMPRNALAGMMRRR